MRSSALITVLFICCCSLLVHCSDDSCIYTTDLRLPGPDVIIPNLVDDISIDYGQTILIEEDDLYISFIHVTEGRCPLGADCFWEGQATTEFRIDLPGKRPMIVKPVIRPSSEPGTSPESTDYGRGYSFTLIQLVPYPELGHDTAPEEYTATLMIEKVLDEGEVDRIIPTRAPPGKLQLHPIIINEGTIDGDVLTLSVSYSGGCGDHAFKLFWNPSFMESYPVQTNLYLQHDNLGDFCEAFITTNISFDIGEIDEKYREVYGGSDNIVLNVYGFFVDEPTDRIQITYSPE